MILVNEKFYAVIWVLSGAVIMERTLNYTLFLDYFAFLLVNLLERILIVLPEKMAMAFGRMMGRVIYILFPDRRKAAIENITIAFGRERSPTWIIQTARKSFEHLGLLAVEFFRIRRWTQQEAADRIIMDGRLPYNLAMLPGNHGICLLASHFGCFEISATTAKFLGLKTYVIVTGVKNPFLSRYFFSRAGRTDEDTGLKIVPHKGIVKDMIRALQEGETVGFLGDQRGDAERGIFVDFFGSRAPANEVFARLAIEGQARVLPLCTYRRDDGRYQSLFGEEVRITLTGDQRQDLAAVSQQFHDVFETWLRLKPEQGFWLQRKWRRKSSKRRTGRTTPQPSPPELETEF